MRYGLVIKTMSMVLLATARVRSIHFMSTDSAFINPQTKSTDLGYTSACWLFPSTIIIAVYCYYSEKKAESSSETSSVGMYLEEEVFKVY